MEPLCVRFTGTSALYAWFRYGVQLPTCKRYTQSVAWSGHGL